MAEPVFAAYAYGEMELGRASDRPVDAETVPHPLVGTNIQE